MKSKAVAGGRIVRIKAQVDIVARYQTLPVFPRHSVNPPADPVIRLSTDN